jgi:hypothetical protein
MIEQPLPPGQSAYSGQSGEDEMESLRREVKRMQHDLLFLRQMLDHLRQELSKARNQER